MHPLMTIIVVLVVCQIVLLASAIYHAHMLHRTSAVSGRYWWKIGPLIGASIMLSLLILWVIGLLPWIGT